ncbi:MAG: hypothetical protein ACK4VV_11595 [Pseudomonas sp.]
MLRTFLLLSACILSLPAMAIELVRYPTHLDNGQGIQALLAPTTDGEKALLQVKGVNHAVDGVVFLAEMQDRGQGGAAYRIAFDGEQRGLLVKSKGWRGESWRLYLPRGAGEFDLYVENEAAGEFDGEAFLALHQKQQNDGLQAALARFDRPRREQENSSILTHKDTEASSQCGRSLSTEVDWSSIEDQQLMELSISGYCGAVVDEIERLCRNDEAFKPLLEGINKVDCRFGERLNLRREGGTLQFTTERNAPNQGEFINGFLRNL